MSLTAAFPALSMDKCELQKFCQSLKEDMHKTQVKMHEFVLQFAKMYQAQIKTHLQEIILHYSPPSVSPFSSHCSFSALFSVKYFNQDSEINIAQVELHTLRTANCSGVQSLQEISKLRKSLQDLGKLSIVYVGRWFFIKLYSVQTDQDTTVTTILKWNRACNVRKEHPDQGAQTDICSSFFFLSRQVLATKS